MRLLRYSFLLAVLVLPAACGDDNPARNAADNAAANVAENVDPSSIKDRVESEVVDRLDCSGYVREETRDSVAATLEGRDLEGLLAEPTELAQAVGAAALTTDTTVLLVGNVTQVARKGHLATALTGNWDDLSCDAPATTEACEDALGGASAGTLATTVQCDGAEVTSVRAEFTDGCRLFGTANAGAMNFEREGNILNFESFKLGTVNEVSGRMAVQTQNDEVSRLTLDSEAPVEIASNVGKSCEERLIFRAFEAVNSASAYSLDMDIERIVGEDVLRVRTVEGPAQWDKPVSCSCPLSGSTIELSMTDPVGLGQTGIVQFAYGAAGGDVCGSSTASIQTWPDGCEGDDTCGRGVAEGLLGALVTTSCLEK